MRTLTAKVAAATAQTITAPHYLVALHFSTPLYLASRPGVVWNGISWVQGDFSVHNLTTRRGGQQGEIRLVDHDGAYGAVVLNEEVRGAKVEIWALYGEPPYADEDPQPLFCGVVHGVPEIGDLVRLSLSTANGIASRLPNIPLAVFLGEDMPAPGTVIHWAGGSVVLEARNG